MEEAFWIWWKKIEADKDWFNLRMAFDAGYASAQKNIAAQIESQIDADHEARAFTLAADIAKGFK